MTTHAYIIRCLTHLHAGSGDSNYGIVDKLVQRDHATQRPAIYSTSLKGALRQFFEGIYGTGSEEVNHIFGQDISREENPNASGEGHFIFEQAHLLTLPMRSDKVQYLSVTTPQIMGEAAAYLSELDVQGAETLVPLLERMAGIPENELIKPRVFHDHLAESIVEEPDFKTEADSHFFAKGEQELADRLLGQNLALMRQQDYQELTLQLPVVARNQLDNGVSKNLWYEELVPRESRFLVCIDEHPTHSDTFYQEVTSRPVQIGGNATVGYGKTKFIPLYHRS